MGVVGEILELSVSGEADPLFAVGDHDDKFCIMHILETHFCLKASIAKIAKYTRIRTPIFGFSIVRSSAEIPS